MLCETRRLKGGKEQPPSCSHCTWKTTKMSEKKKKLSKTGNKIPFHNQYEDSDFIGEFSESEKLLESELAQQLSCFNEYEPECKLNSLTDSRLNDHLYTVYSTKRTETISFMRTWTGFFVRQYRTKLSKRVKPYLESKKLSLDDWLMSVKQGRRGDILLVYVLSIMKGLHTCIHLRNGITWCTLRAVPVHHTELMGRCDIHLGYFGFGIFLRLIKHELPIVLGTIRCDNPDTLNELLAMCHKPEEKLDQGLKKTASAAAGGPSQLPRLSRELTKSVKPKGSAHLQDKPEMTSLNPASSQFSGITASATSAGTAAQKAILSKCSSHMRSSVAPTSHKTHTAMSDTR